MKKTLVFLILAPFLAFAQNQEPWMVQPKESWQKIALVNDVLYKNGNKYEDPTITYAGSGFLLKHSGTTYAVTVKHVLWVARNKASKYVAVNEHLQAWKMYPKNNPKDSVVIDKLLNEDPTEKLFDGWDNGVLQRDWLVFSTRYASPNLQPLILRETAPVIGEKVYLIGNPYRFEQTLIVSGQLFKREGQLLFVKLDGMEKAFLGGASGSPLVDENGHVLGIFSNSRKDDQTGQQYYVINATDYLKKVLAGTKPLNVNKRPVSVYLDSLIQRVKVKKALKQFDALLKTEQAYYDYEITYFNHGNIIKIGENLLSQQKGKDAIQYFDYFYKSRHTHLYLIALAKAYVQQQNKQKAIALLETEKDKMDPEIRGEIITLLNEIKAKQ